MSLIKATIATGKISIPTVLEAFLGERSPEIYDERLRRWAQALVEEAQAKVKVTGAFPTTGTFLLLSNHESLYDIPVLFSVAPLPLRMAAKAELFRVPIWGRAMRLAGFVEIDRRRGREARERLRTAAAALSATGRSLWMAPEGTRGSGEELGAFKSGAFELALELKVPIIPITIRGTARILGKGQRSVRRGVEVQVTVHDVLRPEGYPSDPHELRDKVRVIIGSSFSPAS